jgi:DNA-binding winged helix-turn-helix (wHTH) protein/Tol biopolymer transport system component
VPEQRATILARDPAVHPVCWWKDLQEFGMGRRVKFGPFELDRQTGELWKHGVKVKLQSKPFQVLVALLDRPGEPVSREDLQKRLWSGNTFVDFESGLNTAANRLRITLGDSAENPRYIETLAGSGYRFVAQIEEVSERSPAGPRQSPASLPRWSLSTAALVLATAALALWWVRHSPLEAPRFQQLTFRRGPISGARFAPDGQTILYSAKWESGPWRTFLASSVSPETRSLGFEGSMISAVSRSGELSLLSWEQMVANAGANLSRVPMNGGAPLNVASRVVCSDWSSDGKQLAVVRFEGRESDIEFPLGKILYRTASQLSCLRVSRDGNLIAFIEHPVRGDDGGDIRVLSLDGRVRTLSAGWSSASGVAWSASGKEIWFTAAGTGVTKALWAVTLAGKLRLVARVPGSLQLQDISRDGRTLVIREDSRLEMAGRFDREPGERDLSWFDWTGAEDVSADGKLILFDESGDGGGANWSVYLHRATDGSTLRLGEGHALALAPDGRSAVTLKANDRQRLAILPIGEGPPRYLSGGGIEYHWARYFPDGQHLVVAGNEPGHGLRLYLQAVNGALPYPLAPEIYLREVVVSPDGKWIAGANQDSQVVVCSVVGRERRLIATKELLLPVAWSTDGLTLLVRDLGSVPATIYRIDVSSGRLKLWQKIGPAETTGVQAIPRLFYTPDGNSYVYSFERYMAQLYITDGWK